MEETDPPSSLLLSLLATSGPGPWMALAVTWMAAVLLAIVRAALEESSRTRLLERVTSPRRRGRLERYLEHTDRYEVLLELGRVACEVWIVLSLTTILPATFAGFEGRPLLSLLVAVLWLVPTVHLLPQAVAGRGNAEAILLPWLPALHYLCLPLFPLTHTLLFLRGRTRNLLNSSESAEEKSEITSEIIDVVEEGERKGALREAEAHMIEKVLSFDELTVSEVMTPRTDLTSVSVKVSVLEAVQLAHQEGHSKVPVYEKNRDQIVGLFQLRDAVPYCLDRTVEVPPLKKLLHEPFFIPETKKISQLLNEFQAQQQSFAIVLDEYGGTAGVITVEDILEEIVGELREEHDREEGVPIQHLEDNVVKLDPRLRIEEVNEALETRLPESEEYDTVGGFVFWHLDRIPESGESFVFDNVEFRIVEVDARRIARLELRILETP